MMDDNLNKQKNSDVVSKKLVLVYAPFCTPSVPPYSITNIYSFLNQNLDIIQKKSNVDLKISVLDLNVEFYKANFSEYYKYSSSINDKIDFEEYTKLTNEYKLESSNSMRRNNMKVVNSDFPEKFRFLSDKIKEEYPSHVAFSVVYSSQAFYTLALIKNLKARGIKCLVGGPAVNDVLKRAADVYLESAFDLLKYMENGKVKKFNHDTDSDEELKEYDFTKNLDFSPYDNKGYFNSELVVPLLTSSTCYYKQCTFCTHHGNKDYFEYSLEDIEKTVKNLKTDYIFLIDDMVHKKRLLELAKIFKKYNKKWMGQLRPTSEFDKETLQELGDSGLKCVIWGVESGVDRILGLMKKGTNSNDISKVLKNSRDAGIKNILYMMFGFPSETKDEFLESIDFLKNNSDNIDLVSSSIFGLQKGSPIYNNYKDYGITKITEKKRTILDPQISFEVSVGQTSDETAKLLKNHKKTIENINKYPKMMNFFREHMLVLSNKKTE